MAHYYRSICFPSYINEYYSLTQLIDGNITWSEEAGNTLAPTDISTGDMHGCLAKAEALQGPVIEGFKTKGVDARQLPIPILRELNRIADDVMAEEALRDSDFRVIRDSQIKFRESYAVWKRLAYLPRDF